MIDSIEREIELEVRKRFPGDAVERAVLRLAGLEGADQDGRHAADHDRRDRSRGGRVQLRAGERGLIGFDRQLITRDRRLR